jgi:transposase
MSAAYWSAINENLSDAALVFDHFHIIKLANEKIDEIRRGLQRTLELAGQKFIKGTRYLLLCGIENLPPNKLPKLEEALAYNEPLSKACYLKEELRQLWNQPDKAAAQQYLQEWILKAYATCHPATQTARQNPADTRAADAQLLRPSHQLGNHGGYQQQNRTPHSHGLWLPRCGLPSPAHLRTA